MSKKPSPSTIAVNKKARHLYELSDFVEAGISLTGHTHTDSMGGSTSGPQ